LEWGTIFRTLVLSIIKEQRAKSKEQRAKSKEQRAKNKEQRTKNKEQRTKNKEQRTKNKDKTQFIYSLQNSDCKLYMTDIIFQC
jgi:hypothetical protein